MFAALTETIRRALRPRPHASCKPVPVPVPELVRLQFHLSATCGGGVIGCPCGGLITPVVNRHSSGMGIVALACIACYEVEALDEPGILAAAEAAPASAATVH